MRAEDLRPAVVLSDAQRRVVTASGPTTHVLGPAGSGKTMALAARALASRARGCEPLIVCSHQSGCVAFQDALAALAGPNRDELPFRVATLAEHAAAWLRSAYESAQCAPQIAVGGRGAARDILAQAARGLLDMTWPLFARADIDLDLPHLSRPEAFLDGASGLFTLLQRARIGPEEFEEGCAAGLAAFYGQGIERAEVLAADPAVRKRASSRGKDALRASAQTLAAQRTAERDTAKILAQLYRDYRTKAGRAGVRPAEDLVESLTRWLEADGAARAAMLAAVAEIIVDDAEDAEPALVPLLRALRKDRDLSLVLAGAESSKVDGFEGRRSALSAIEGAQAIELAMLAAPAQRCVERFADETLEADWIAARIGDLLRAGVAPETIAVLSRSEHAAGLYAQALRERGVPASQPSSSLEREQEMADLLALCAVVDDPLDEQHLLRVLSSPVVGLSDEGLWAVCRDPLERLQLALDVGAQPKTAAKGPPKNTLARNVQTGAADGTLPESTRARLVSLRARLTSWRERCAGLSPVERFMYVASAAGFRDRWHDAAAHERRRLHEDLVRVGQAVEQAATLCDARDFPTIARLIEDEVVALGPAAHVPGAVVTDTVVAVKGLRFDHVFVAGVAHQRFPRIYTSHAMAFSRTYGLIVRENVAAGAAQTAKFAWYYAKFGAKAMYLGEERRALDYGLSRARMSAYATGYGTPPYWAREQDLLGALGTSAGREGGGGE